MINPKKSLRRSIPKSATISTEVPAEVREVGTIRAGLVSAGRSPSAGSPSVLELEQQVDALADLFRGEEVEVAVGREVVKQARAAAARVRQRLARRFGLVVMGDFKRGKSTLINSLLGRPVVTSNVLPETITINHLTYGGQPGVTAEFADGRQVLLTWEDLPANRLATALERVGGKPTRLLINTDVAWLDGIELIDTPGLGDLFFRFQDEITAFLPRADAIIYVVSAISPLSESERDFLLRNVRPLDFSKLIFVVNLMDCIESESESERVLKSIRGKLHRTFPSAPVFGVSALDELCRAQGLPRPRPERAASQQASFELFRAYLMDTIVLNRDLVQIERAGAELSGVLEDISGGLRRLEAVIARGHEERKAMENQLADRNSDLHRQIAGRREHLRREVMWKGDQAAVWMTGFLERVATNSFRSLKDFAYDDVQKSLPFFLDDRFASAFEGCLQAHQSELLECLGKERDGVTISIAGGAATSVGVQSAVADADFGSAAWHSLDNFSLLARQLPPMRLLGGVYASLRRGEKIAQYQESLERSLPRLKSGIVEETRAMYGRIADVLEGELLRQTQERVDAALTALRQTEAVNQEGDLRAAEARRKLAWLGERLHEIAGEVRASRDRWQAASGAWEG